MPKIIKSGIFGPGSGMPENPPAGIKTTCGFCRAHLETVENEKGYKLGKKINSQEVLFVGWNIRCPECRRKVFFPYLNGDVLKNINGRK